MGLPLRLPRLVLFLAAMGTTVGQVPSTLADYSVSNNLTGTSGGVESALGATWITAGFSSGTTGGQLRSITLLLADSVAGRAEVDIYSDAGLAPGSLVGALNAPGSYSSTLANTTFTASGIILAANTNYWVVLKALTGQFDWSWTLNNTGTGTGYQNTWGESDDSGSTWFTYDSYPTQMNVTLASSATVPEPSTLVLWGAGLIGVAAFSKRSRASSGTR